jgi:hnRNP-L/PTB/hephaestus splicing factor
MNPNQVNQMNPMQQHQMNQHMMSMQQQQQNFMNQNQMMNPMQQFNQSAQYSQPQAQHQQQHAVLLVSNLDPEKITCYDLFILFGVYGNVLRVKVLYNKKDNALLQMSDGQQAETAMMHLNNRVMLHGRQLRIIKSKHQHVQMPKDGQEGANLTQDYTNSPLHRFKKPGSKNFQNIHPPSETLHLSNIPLEVNDQQLKEKFQQTGSNVVDFRFFQKDRRMALIQLGSIDEAVTALVKLHNEKLSETNHLRVSFSRTQISQS